MNAVDLEAEVIVISPFNTDNTMRSFFSTGIVGGRLMTFMPLSRGVASSPSALCLKFVSLVG